MKIKIIVAAIAAAAMVSVFCFSSGKGGLSKAASGSLEALTQTESDTKNECVPIGGYCREIIKGEQIITYGISLEAR